jgi:hypothetical protein
MSIPEVNAESFFNKTDKYQIPRKEKIDKINKNCNPFQESLDDIFEDSDMEGSFLEDEEEEEEKLELDNVSKPQKVLTMDQIIALSQGNPLNRMQLDLTIIEEEKEEKEQNESFLIKNLKTGEVKT